MTENKNCQAYRNQYYCNALINKDCNNCKFFKTEKAMYEANQKALKKCMKLNLGKYIPILKNLLKQKGDFDE